MTETRQRVRLAIACYPTYGGSGVLATELGLALAERGHQVHFLSYEPPQRLAAEETFRKDVFFHQVQVPPYPLFRYPPYALALASKMAEVIEDARIQVLHVHYAIPHAVSAVMAREMAHRDVRILTTLHGTDVTLVGQDQSYLRPTRYGIERSDGVTAVSRHLAGETKRIFCPDCEIHVIPNFVDTERYRPVPCEETQGLFRKPGEKLLVHVSNFRPVKRPLDVIEIFSRVRKEIPARLLLIGDGPELPATEARAVELGVRDSIQLLGRQAYVEKLLPCADLLLLPSETESFGLAALEAMACGVPPVASDVGGLPEVVQDGVSGILGPVGDVEGLARRTLDLLADPDARCRMAEEARRRAVEDFDRSIWVAAYESAYCQLLSR